MPADPRFHRSVGPQKLAAILAACGGASDGAPGLEFAGVEPLDSAGPAEIAYLEASKHVAKLAGCRAGAVLLRAADAGLVPAGCLAIVVAAPALAFAAVARLFHPPPQAQGRRHPSAVVGAGAIVADDVDIGAFATIGEGAEIGPGSIIHPHACIGPGVVLGAGCTIHSHASISHAVCGARVTLHPGARVGQEGFGFTRAAHGFVTMPQLGRVLLGDGVEVGANACIDRGALVDTVIGAGCRIDNLVQVGHNVRLGQSCVLVALAGIAGSSVLEDGVVMAAQSGVADHLRIGAGARIGAQAGIIKDVPAGADMLGMPAQPIRQFLRETAMLRRLAAPSQTGEKGRARAPRQEK